MILDCFIRKEGVIGEQRSGRMDVIEGQRYMCYVNEQIVDGFGRRWTRALINRKAKCLGKSIIQ